MKCPNCDGDVKSVRDDLVWEDHFSGRLLVEDVDYRLCDGCGERFLPPATMRAIESSRKEKIDQWLENRPLKDFWDSRQVTEYLGLTRQALSKGVRVNNLIYKTRRLGKYCYLADSVKEFKRTGDGRLQLEFCAETDEVSAPTALTTENFASSKPFWAIEECCEPLQPSSVITTATRRMENGIKYAETT